jgi:hypothetical protein
MSHDDDLDLSAYDEAVVEHALFGLARAHVLDRLAQGTTWDVDLGAGTLSLGRRRHRAQILGTFAKGSRNFLWAWANPGASSWEPSLEVVSELRTLAGRKGNALFGVKSIAEGWVNPRELAYVSGELAGGFPVYAPDAGHATVFLVVTDAGVDPHELPLAALPDLFFDFQSFAMVDLSACVARFLVRLGFEVSATDARTSGWRTRDGAAVTIDWRGDGRIGHVDVSAGQAATG